MERRPCHRKRLNPLVTACLDAAYVAAGLAAVPVSLLRGRISRTADHFRRRLLEPPPMRAGEKRAVWIHGVSVGEVLSVRRLVGRLEEALADWEVVLSSSTSAGVEAARQAFAPRTVFSCPLDFGFAVRRALQRVRPDALVIVEHDLWPNLLRYADAAGVPVALVNARISRRSAAAYRRFSWICPWPPRSLAAVCVQDEASAAVFRELGFPAERLSVCGNLKFDNPPAAATGLREAIGFEEPDWVLVAGSTHGGEEEAVLEAFARVRERHPASHLLLVPRRLERVPDVARLVRERGFSCMRWSQSRRKGPEVILVDTVGELAQLCAAGDVVFVGGSLVPVGGHNVVEPAAYARPVLIGPHFHNQRSIVETFLDAQAIAVVRDAADLAKQLIELRENRARARELGRRAVEVVERNRGAGERTFQVLCEVLRSVEARG